MMMRTLFTALRMPYAACARASSRGNALATANGELRITELAERALISRSGMTRRVTRLVGDGLVRRYRASSDARGVVVALTDAGIARLAETAPVHARGISKLFVDQLDDRELALLERALNKVILDCSFG